MRRDNGFTLVELVTIMVVLGILSAYAAPRFFDANTFQERGYFDELKQALRYAQKSAITSGCPVTFSVDAAGNYAAIWATTAVCTDGTSPAADVPLPGFAGVLAGAPPGGVAVGGGPVAMTFDRRGMTAGTTVITVGPRSMTVHPTGYVQG